MTSFCSCMSLKIGTIILAITDGVFNAFILLALMFVGVYVVNPEDIDDEARTVYDISSVIICAVSIVLSLCQILLAVELGRAAENGNFLRLRRWLVITAVVFAILVTNVSMQMTLMTKNLNMPFGIVGIVGALFKFYEMLIVSLFIKEINKGRICCSSSSGENC